MHKPFVEISNHSTQKGIIQYTHIKVVWV